MKLANKAAKILLPWAWPPSDPQDLLFRRNTDPTIWREHESLSLERIKVFVVAGPGRWLICLVPPRCPQSTSGVLYQIGPAHESGLLPFQEFCELVVKGSHHGSLPGSSVHGILQARIPEWIAMPFSRESS